MATNIMHCVHKNALPGRTTLVANCNRPGDLSLILSGGEHYHSETLSGSPAYPWGAAIEGIPCPLQYLRRFSKIKVPPVLIF